MSRKVLKEIVSILRESPIYRTLPATERRTIIKELAEKYSFGEDGNGGEVVGYESSWAGIIKNSM
jgi:hypothetical protein